MILRFDYLLTLWFVLCFLPLSTSSGISYNYIFVLTPLILFLFAKRVINISISIVWFFLAIILLFIFSYFFNFENSHYYDRQILSFFCFLSIFALSLSSLSKSEIKNLMVASVVMSLFLSAKQIFNMLNIGVFDPFLLKDVTGSQRLGFIYLFSFWWLIQKQIIYQKKISMAYIYAVCIMIGLFLTFSRASYVALTGSIIYFFIFSNKQNALANQFSKKSRITLSLALLIAISLVCSAKFRQFLSERLFFNFQITDLQNNLNNPITSEGTRIELWKVVIEKIQENPIIGNHFQGIWTLTDISGSAHNEYFDKLLRLGIPLFTFFVLLLWKVFKNIKFAYPELETGFIAVIIYGFFHETFKESQGALILSFYLMLLSSGKYEHAK